MAPPRFIGSPRGEKTAAIMKKVEEPRRGGHSLQLRLQSGPTTASTRRFAPLYMNAPGDDSPKLGRDFKGQASLVHDFFSHVGAWFTLEKYNLAMTILISK